ncbi:MAG TPA: TPM domain-containing protein [Polyangiaceae bacterium]
MSLLSESDLRRIEDAIREVETKSATELVVAVVPRSADYWQARLVVAVAWSLATAHAVLQFRPDVPPLVAILLEVPVGVLTFFLFGRGALARLLLPRGAAAEAVERRALELFAAQGLTKTRDRTGMLILLSELEHRVVILGDRGIHERVGDAGWREHVDHVIAAIHRGEAARGLLEVIERLGAKHAELNPVRPGDTNELPDGVVRG